MACSSGGCDSGCYRDSNQEEQDHFSAGKNQAPNDVGPIGNRMGYSPDVCIKCKSNQTIVSDGDAVRFCADCFRNNLFGKFRFAVTSNAMISPSDNILVAFSGGPASRVALQFVHEMQQKAQNNFDACRDKSLSVFSVGVAFIDESDINPVPSHEFDKAVEDMEQIVSNLDPPRKEFHVASIESIYSFNTKGRRENLKELLNAVSDSTGKEDLLLHLRMLSLQKIARKNGYTKLVLGSCASRIACHFIAATVKGQGYSVAADMQYVDSRWDIPVVLPLRDCLIQELKMLCSLDRLRTLEILDDTRSGINGLVSSFVKLLKEENPSRECTIVRTAGKLTPFHFNKIEENDESNVHSESHRRQKKFNLRPNESLSSESFCLICNSPLNNSDLLNLRNNMKGRTESEIFGAACCSSCQFQILPKEPSSVNHFYSLLPQLVTARAKDGRFSNQRWPRDQIRDCLLLESEDESEPAS